MHVLLIDNFDSFSFNLVDELRKRGGEVDIWRNDVTAERALALIMARPAPRLIVLSPGPSAPSQAGCCIELIRLAKGKVPLFGVCLGHQAIIEAFGGKVGYAGEVVHGKSDRVLHAHKGLMANLPLPLPVARYHSLVAERVPDELEVTAWLEGGMVMAVEHREALIAGVQFHPESILTPAGGKLLEGVIRWASDHTNEQTND